MLAVATMESPYIPQLLRGSRTFGKPPVNESGPIQVSEIVVNKSKLSGKVDFGLEHGFSIFVSQTGIINNVERRVGTQLSLRERGRDGGVCVCVCVCVFSRAYVCRRKCRGVKSGWLANGHGTHKTQRECDKDISPE